MPRPICLALLACCMWGAPAEVLYAQTLEQRLLAEDPAKLAAAALNSGDARRGAIVFYQPYMACTKCHVVGDKQQSLGPDLAKVGRDIDGAAIVESLLKPSQVIRKGYEPVTVVTSDGKSLTGLIAVDEADRLVLRDPARDGKLVTIPKADIDRRVPGKLSIMPAGQVNVLAGRQQFLDLVRYLIDIRDGGLARARELEPPPSLYAARPLPEYEQHIDHAGMLADFDKNAFKRGEAIYNRLCVNCHGTHDKPGSLPTSLRFAEGKFKNGSDPHTMYQTLTRGFGMMVPQAWMVPQQKYDAIHYVREAYLKSHNPSQYFAVDAEYLAGLPAGNTRGPEPSNILPWAQMDYGPNLVATYEVGRDATNFAYKGNAIRLDPGPGGVSQGRHWMVFDYDTLRMAAGWSSEGFIDFNGINFNDRHGVHPRVVGKVQFANATGPGWANPKTGTFDDPRLRGRDGRPYGPLPRDWAQLKGMYAHGQQSLLSYTVGDTDVLELPGFEVVQFEGKTESRAPVFRRTFNIGPRRRPMLLQVASRGDGPSSLKLLDSTATGGSVALFGGETSDANSPRPVVERVEFNGGTFLQVARPQDFHFRNKDFTIAARIKTRSGGTIFCKTAPQTEWVPDGKALFVRGGRLCYDIGWVGVVQSRQRVNDGKWHDVAVTFQTETGNVQLFVDGKPDGGRQLKAKEPVAEHVVRIGYTAANFPRERSFFEGDIAHVQFYQKALSAEEVAATAEAKEIDDKGLVASWDLSEFKEGVVPDKAGGKHDAKLTAGRPNGANQADGHIVAGTSGDSGGAEWKGVANNLRLQIPAGAEPLKFTLWTASIPDESQVAPLLSALVLPDAAADLTPFTKGGPPRWPNVLTTEAVIGKDDGPFAVDVLTHPVDNPWFCRMRLTGFDFYPDGDRAAVCSWDGSVWLVSGLLQLSDEQSAAGSTASKLQWRRIASGLFQPLGLKIVDGKIYVGCRDQICLLHDLNGDGETDFYENFNNDHQVTDHFHEFAMGLQTDAEGNFYYAKSARHALTAVVPQHGTLLKVSKDGSQTEILATGFRAANGVCLNPDGSFIVTDQEGHWNPKNRINWVEPGGFYGNMFGYHDVTDESDDAMQQPLCWITNAFDRSPAELLWVDGNGWGPLSGSLLNLSYGYGKVYIVPHEDVDGQKQGGMCALPIPQFPTGTMRGRFHPQDGQLYVCGMFAWGGAQQQPGGFYRIRYTGKAVHLPVGLNAKKDGMQLTFSGELDRDAASDASNYSVKSWSLKRTANYGSKHYDERRLEIAAAELSPDGRSVSLKIPEMQPTWCMEIRYSLQSAEGEAVEGVVHNTVHSLR